MLSNLIINGNTSFAYWREQNRKIGSIKAKLDDPLTENNKMFFVLVEKIQQEFNLLEEVFLLEVETRNNLEKVEVHKKCILKMIDCATESKKLTQKLQTQLEQYKD